MEFGKHQKIGWILVVGKQNVEIQIQEVGCAENVLHLEVEKGLQTENSVEKQAERIDHLAQKQQIGYCDQEKRMQKGE